MHKRQSGDRGRDSELRRKQKLGEFELFSSSTEKAWITCGPSSRDSELFAVRDQPDDP